MARRRLVVVRRGFAGFGDLPMAGVSTGHVPGEQWTMGANQGCASGFVEQELDNGNWTCIPFSDFQKVQAGDYRPLSQLPVFDVYRHPAPTLTLPSGETVETHAANTMTPVHSYALPANTNIPAPTPSYVPNAASDRTPSGSVAGQQFADANPDNAMPAVQSTGGTGGTSPTTAAASSTPASDGVPWLLLAGAGLLFVVLRQRRGT